jgi:acetate kinase
MRPTQKNILTLNGGSSSIKFSLYECNLVLRKILYGKIERIGLTDTTLTFTNLSTQESKQLNLGFTDQTSAAQYLIDWIAQTVNIDNIDAVGHRIVHGLQHTQPEVVSPVLVDELNRISTYDPEHLPLEMLLIQTVKKSHPNLLQVACFDTAFHHRLPRVAKILPIPRRFDALGIQRYGFHGLSYAYLMQELTSLDGEHAANGKVILAHLGNGASLAAVKNGMSIDTSMGFTPSGGIPMGTRSGDIDPGVAWYVMQNENLTLQQFNHLINHESGLLGVSETSADMRDLLKIAPTDVRAKDAIDLFCYQVKKLIGAYSAALHGLDTLIFTGGIGENSAEVRAQICADMDFLGVSVDQSANERNAEIISAKNSRVKIRIIHTDEELMIVKSTCQILDASTTKENLNAK